MLVQDIERKQQKLNEEKKRLEGLKRKRDGTTSAPVNGAKKKMSGLAYIQSPVFSLI